MNTKCIILIVISVLSCIEVLTQNKNEYVPYQTPFNKPGILLTDTIRLFTINDFCGSFFSRILILKTGKIVGFDIFKMRLKINDDNYIYYKRVDNNLNSFSDYPDSVKLLYPAIESLIYNRLYVQIKDTSAIETDTILVIWGRSIGIER